MAMLPLLLMVGAAASPVPAATDACSTAARDYRRKADLPRDIIAALGADMAEKGAPFQVSDVVTKPRLPATRFVSASQRACVVTIDYEQGGIAHRWLSRRFVRNGGNWVTAPL